MENHSGIIYKQATKKTIDYNWSILIDIIFHN